MSNPGSESRKGKSLISIIGQKLVDGMGEKKKKGSLASIRPDVGYIDGHSALFREDRPFHPCTRCIACLVVRN